MLEDEPKTPLARWFVKTGRTKSDFAAKVECTPGRISQICDGETPSLKLAIKIMKETSGEVSCSDLLSGGVIAHEAAE